MCILLAVRRRNTRYPADDLGIGASDDASVDISLLPAAKHVVVFQLGLEAAHTAIVVIARKKKGPLARPNEKLAATYSPRGLPPKYHRRERA